MLSSSLYQLIDGILVGQFLGETAFAALNLAMPFVIVNFALADLIGVGSSVPISISLGQKKDEHSKQYFFLFLSDDRHNRHSSGWYSLCCRTSIDGADGRRR